MSQREKPPSSNTAHVYYGSARAFSGPSAQNQITKEPELKTGTPRSNERCAFAIPTRPSDSRTTLRSQSRRVDVHGAPLFCATADANSDKSRTPERTASEPSSQVGSHGGREFAGWSLPSATHIPKSPLALPAG